MTIEATDLQWCCRRASFGATPALLAEAETLGWTDFVDRQLAPASIDDSELDQRLTALPSLLRTAVELRDTYDGPGRRLAEARIWRALFSRRQLYERVIDVWTDLFSIDQSVGEGRLLVTVSDRDAIRRHALGRFEDLLTAVARSAAMLEYLDNRANRAEAPNENFARELLELHTLGVGSYDENDVREAARCFTGWTMRPYDHERFGEFHFDAAQHDVGSKRFLGREIAAGGGESDGVRVLGILARHPATARRVARKLLVAFVTDEPAGAEVERVATVFTSSHGDLRTVVRAVFDHASLGDVAKRPRARFQRPLRFVASTLRALDARVDHMLGLAEELAGLGHAPYAWPTPDGYPENRAVWESALLSRWRFVEALVEDRIDGVRVDASALFAGITGAERARRANELLEGGKLGAHELAVLRDIATGDANDRRVLALALCFPSAQEF